MAAITLPEFMKMEQDPLRKGVIKTLYTEEKFLQYIPFETIPGLAIPYDQEESLPSVAFRKINAAYTPSVGVVNRLVETLKPFGCESDTDRALISAYGEGQRSKRLAMHLHAMAIKYVQTFIYGNSPIGRAGAAFTDVDGFDGLQARMSGGVAPSATAQMIDATGTTGSNGSSVIVLRLGDRHCCGLQTKDGVAVDDMGLVGTAKRTQVEHVAGMAVYNGKSCSWIYDITAAAGLTCDLLDQAVDLIDGDPTLILMTKRSQRQLKTNAKTAGTLLGTSYDLLGRRINNWGGIPIITTDAMIDTESVA